ncbi:MAG TPA: hypothetical protein VEF72_07455 [Mycobacterium sp.]|nr:hypothetical protein [Mycobacterium sp.]
MATGTLDVPPSALRAASLVIAGHAARVAAPSAPATESAEMSGVVAAAFGSALDGYCAAFGRRLSSVSAALVGAAGSFTAMEDVNSQALASIARATRPDLRTTG